MSPPWTTTASATLGADGDIVTLIEGLAFAISLPSGDMLPGFPHGLFFRDTRLLSDFRLLVNGQAPEPLASTTVDPFSASFVLREVPAPGTADSHLVVFRNRHVGRGMREDLIVRNYGLEPAFCAIELAVDSDFADLFEVKEGRVVKAGERSSDVGERRLTWWYRRGPFSRGVHVDFSVAPRLSPNEARFDVIVPAGAEWSLCIQITPVVGAEEVTPRHLCGRPVERAMPTARLEAWRRNLPKLTTEHDSFAALLDRSSEDLATLRLFDADHPDRAVVAAGAPWFMTLFGRDSLLTSWMTMMIDSDLALGTLQTLERYQGTDVNPITEEEPGRILHEMRFGETGELSLGGGRVYYGNVDATPLFVMLLGELRRWGTAGKRSTRCYRPRIARSAGSRTSATETTTGTWSTSAPAIGVSATKGGRTRSTRRGSRTDGWRRHRSRSARCRATCTPPTLPAHTSPRNKATASTRASCARGRPG